MDVSVGAGGHHRRFLDALLFFEFELDELRGATFFELSGLVAAAMRATTLESPVGVPSGLIAELISRCNSWSRLKALSSF